MTVSAILLNLYHLFKPPQYVMVFLPLCKAQHAKLPRSRKMGVIMANAEDDPQKKKE